MTTNWNETGNDRLLASLALALVDQPRASLQELAKAVGIGKSTLHRFCSTRDELVERMAQHGAYRLIEAAKAAKLDQDSPLEAFKRLNTTHFEQRELAAFLTTGRPPRRTTPSDSGSRHWMRFSCEDNSRVSFASTLPLIH
ncbi:hypothetical protein [Pseudomonas paraeruginosa]|uniref:hypothetical protein n=1 Tax=Pseudomonas paraeruginosa TaxID=2994495 RepID=UPI001CD95B05|nr:hypothetical protein [Pseudomonas aeruginosa]